MNKQIKALDKEIDLYCKQNNRYDEIMFNLGVQMGRLLEKNNISSYRPNAFIEFEKENEAYDRKAEQIRRADKAIGFLIRNAIAQHVDKHGEFIFDAAYHNEKIDDEFVEKFYIQHEHTTQVNDGDTFEAAFSINGDVADILSKYNVPLTARADVDNTTGDDREAIYDASDIDKIFGVSLRINGHYTDLDEAKLTELADDLEKITAWLTLSLPNPR